MQPVMKMRYIVAGYTVAVVLLLCFVYMEMTKENQFDVDMVYYNRQLKQVETELESLLAEGQTVSESDKDDVLLDEVVREIEADYDCIVLLRQSENYGQRLNELISDGAVIFDYFHNGELAGKIAWEMAKNRYESLSRKRAEAVFIIVAVLTVAGYLLLAVIYYLFIRPFHVLERFSGDVAKGNLDFSLPMKKRNMFGAFTESFDIMREELKNAREREYQANISKKELVAELSHDIKTPVSTIKATCEVMQITEKNQDTLHKIDVIINKADMIDQLIGNMFHATMEELQALKVEATEESSLAIPVMFNDLKYYGNIIMKNQIPECLVKMDKLRMKQVIDNIVNNSYKYAGTDIDVSFKEKNQDGGQAKGIRIIIRDHGNGVPEEELALISEKFYRGANAKGKSGSGIGLYLSKSFMQQMGGELDYYNDNGFVVELFVRKV